MQRQMQGPMFEWDQEDNFSFEDSDRFEEDSICSWISEPESVVNNWRGWRKNNASLSGGGTRSIHGKGFIYLSKSPKCRAEGGPDRGLPRRDVSGTFKKCQAFLTY